MKNPRLVSLCTVAAALVFASGTAVASDDVTTGPGGSPFTLTSGRVFYTPAGPIENFRAISVPGTNTVAYLWNEKGSPFYAISRDGGKSIAGRVRETDYTIKLAYANFDPMEFTPGVNEQLKAAPTSELHLVQFWTVSLEEYQTQIEAMGGEIVRFMANHTHIVRMPASVADEVAKLPYVRWTGPFHPAYKVSPEILSQMLVGMPESLSDYSIEVFDRGGDQQNLLADRILATGGKVITTDGHGFRMTVSLMPSQIMELVTRDELHYIDPWGPAEVDTDLAKILNGVTGGANIANLGFTGNDVRGEIFDTGIEDHPDLRPRLQHNGGGGGGHGTNVAGIPSGNGTNGGPTGFAPDRPVVIWTNATGAQGSSQFGGPFSRYVHTAELVDPNDQFQAVWQTSSVGSPRTRVYNTISAETDDYLFISQLLSTQSMSNASLTPDVRPQAWAKNIVGVGGVNHNNNLNKLDDSARGSTGPAQDDRIKPDLTHHYDNIWTTSGSSGYTTGFGGTSGATPTTVGNFALLFEMWQQEVFPGHGNKNLSVFAARPKMTTAKAMMINQAERYDWYSGSASANNRTFFRDRQGWGMATVGNLYTNRNKMMIQDEPGPILPLETQSYDFEVPNGEPVMFVTMVYADPMGPTSANQHRINDLSLRVTSPGGTVYWGNNGLRSTNFSSAGGSSNTLDTVENVFIDNPQAGRWKIEVIADEIVQDGHVETAALDADYSLVASGGQEVKGVAMRIIGSPPNLVAPGTPVDLTVSITPGLSSIVPGTEKYHYRFDSAAFTTADLTPIGNGEYTASIPGGACGDLPQFYFSVEDAQTGPLFLPTNGAASPFTYDIGALATMNEFAEDFEGGGLPGGWSATGLWNITSSCSPATPCNGTFFAYFGQTASCTYNIGARATGTLKSPVIAVPAFNPAGGATLTYCYNYEREANPIFDKAQVIINGDIVDEPPTTNTWDTRQVDLSKYAGQNIRVEFFFDSTDGFSNNFRGFQVDGISVDVTDTFCGGCPACACDFDTSTGANICDIFDFLAFQNAFVAGDACAIDLNTSTGVGVADIFDFLDFQNSFVGGPCP
jgi:Subtilase family